MVGEVVLAVALVEVAAVEARELEETARVDEDVDAVVERLLASPAVEAEVDNALPEVDRAACLPVEALEVTVDAKLALLVTYVIWRRRKRRRRNRISCIER